MHGTISAHNHAPARRTIAGRMLTDRYTARPTTPPFALLSRHALETLQTWLSPAVAAMAQEDQHEEKKTTYALSPILRSLSSMSCSDTPPASLRTPCPVTEPCAERVVAAACARGPKAPERVAAAPCAAPCGHGPEAQVCFAAERKRSFAESIQTLKADAEAQEPVVALVCRVLDRTVVGYSDQRIASKPATDSYSSHPPFEGTHPCPLSPSEYVERILKYTRCSPCNLIVGLVYLQRLKDLDADGKRTRLTSYNIQRLLLTALMLASKFLDEPHASNKQWALVGDLSVQEMNSLELEMLWLLKFSLTISRDEYDECSRQLETLSNCFD